MPEARQADTLPNPQGHDWQWYKFVKEEPMPEPISKGRLAAIKDWAKYLGPHITNACAVVWLLELLAEVRRRGERIKELETENAELRNKSDARGEALHLLHLADGACECGGCKARREGRER